MPAGAAPNCSLTLFRSSYRARMRPYRVLPYSYQLSCLSPVLSLYSQCELLPCGRGPFLLECVEGPVSVSARVFQIGQSGSMPDVVSTMIRPGGDNAGRALGQIAAPEGPRSDPSLRLPSTGMIGLQQRLGTQNDRPRLHLCH